MASGWKHKEETKARIAAFHKGRKRSGQTGQRISDGLAKHYSDSENLAKARSRNARPEYRAKLRAAWTPERKRTTNVRLVIASKRGRQAEALAAERLKSEGWSVIKGGWPDLFCHRNNGRGFAVKCVEVKTGTQTMSPRQEEVAGWLRSFGIEVEVLTMGES